MAALTDWTAIKPPVFAANVSFTALSARKPEVPTTTLSRAKRLIRAVLVCPDVDLAQRDTCRDRHFLEGGNVYLI